MAFVATVASSDVVIGSNLVVMFLGTFSPLMWFLKSHYTISDLSKTIACISTFAFLMTNSVFWLICILEQFGFGYYVTGTPVTVGVTMYVLSISSVSEVMMVLKNLFSKKIVMFFVCLPCKLVLSKMYLHISKWPYWAAKWSGVLLSSSQGFLSLMDSAIIWTNEKCPFWDA